MRLPSKTIVLGFFWAAVTVAIFAGWFVVTRFSVTRELRLWDVTALRFGIGAIILGPLLLRREKRISAEQWREGLLYACLWGLPFVLAVAFGLQLTSAGRAAAITPTLMPVFAGIFSWIFFKEKQGRLRWAGYFTIVVGLVWMTTMSVFSHGMPDPVGILALMAAAAMWAVYTLLFRRSALTPIQSAALICCWSSILFLPVYLGFGLSRLPLASPAEICMQAAYQGVLMSGVAIASFNRSVTILGPAAATAIIALVPIFSSLLAIPILGELPSPTEFVALAAVVGGVLLSARAARRTTTLSIPTTTGSPS